MRAEGLRGRTSSTSTPGYAVLHPFLNADAFTSNSAPYSIPNLTFRSIFSHTAGNALKPISG